MGLVLCVVLLWLLFIGELQAGITCETTASYHGPASGILDMSYKPQVPSYPPQPQPMSEPQPRSMPDQLMPQPLPMPEPWPMPLSQSLPEWCWPEPEWPMPAQPQPMPTQPQPMPVQPRSMPERPMPARPSGPQVPSYLSQLQVNPFQPRSGYKPMPKQPMPQTRYQPRSMPERPWPWPLPQPIPWTIPWPRLRPWPMMEPRSHPQPRSQPRPIPQQPIPGYQPSGKFVSRLPGKTEAAPSTDGSTGYLGVQLMGLVDLKLVP